LQIRTLIKGICEIWQLSIWMLGEGKLLYMSIKADTRSWWLWNVCQNCWSKQSRSCWSDGGLHGAESRSECEGSLLTFSTEISQRLGSRRDWAEQRTRPYNREKALPTDIEMLLLPSQHLKGYTITIFLTDGSLGGKNNPLCVFYQQWHCSCDGQRKWGLEQS